MGSRVAPVLPNNLDGRRGLAIQESDTANHSIRGRMVGRRRLELLTSTEISANLKQATELG